MAGDTFENGEEFRIVERPAENIGADLDAASAEFAYRTVHFFQRGRYVVHRQRGDEGGEFVGPAAADFGQTVIADACRIDRHVRAAKTFRVRKTERENLLHLRPLASSSTRASMSHSTRILVMRLTMPLSFECCRIRSR